ncbi:MAG: enolase C-terminal domain-like protein [Desulfobacterales bacterium]|jgi:muconate cycloisomerase
MTTIAGFEVYAVELPFKKPFKHAAAERKSSYSLLLRCDTDSGVAGFGECLPREYVTGESRDGAFDMLTRRVLPRLLGKRFDSLEEVQSFLSDCNGKAPADWVDPATPQTAAWAAVDLSLLDAVGKATGRAVRLPGGNRIPAGFRFSVVFSAATGPKAVRSLITFRLFGFKAAKLKIEAGSEIDTARLARRILGKHFDLRVDANMAWSVDEAAAAMARMSRFGITSFEQPLAASDIDGLARLVRETGLGVMVDESLSDAQSLETLIDKGACTAVNARISKCGGLMAAYNRCLRALEAGLTVQVGAQVGETSLLSAAQLMLITAVGRVRYGEGCFGLHLLKEDPFSPLVQFGFGGRPPSLPEGPGLGVVPDPGILNRWCVRKQHVA